MNVNWMLKEGLYFLHASKMACLKPLAMSLLLAGTNFLRIFEKCLIVYPILEFKKLYAKVAGLSEFNPDYRKLQRNFFRGNTVVELDSSGRFLIPKQMLNYAQLEKQVVVVGMGNKVELWNPELYKEQLYDNQNEFSDHVQKYLDI